ncbi:ABC superfamily ATP binding cassette transporter, binding protein [Agrilactobacillus composti DSM 18527 = JCM 14202]|uniref:ABC superfamily ATP binding cassette transporter, binding protein n=1 Tax=Agrilactobacillus composti DSM 18527 = JCM 14202 TaxID=1423734 RepID=X0PPR8_9LACO|nr:metal ABC transporter solute-binding protein [Agrilactobacillus composti]KRM30491.1 ABC superfamily ATP binding cassette transporter, binding protein [Agrilactobacillus composti DSM 18527 = JCM 14202]GAF38986.1 zinc ABC transporter, periplasmic-binding protein ZnuA [Agrilactobacillus composti DSM 18527 = JCM 14202]
MIKISRKFRNIALVLGTLALALTFTACGSKTSQSASSNGKTTIVATTDFYGEVAKAVAGNKATVTSIINKPNVDPHDYEPTTKVAKEVTGANIIVANGIGYDAWMNKLASNANDAKYIKVGEDLMNKKTGDNPHLWYNPDTMPKLANEIAAQLGKKQPKNKKYFTNNAAKYIASLQPVNEEISQLKQKAAKVANKDVYVSEPVFDYAIEAMGFKVGNESFEKSTENSTDPAPAAIKAMQAGIKAKKIAFFVYNSQVDSKTVNNFVSLSKANNIPVLKVTETLPAGKNYKTWMLSQYQELNKILDTEAK